MKSMQRAKEIATYAELLKQVRETIALGKNRALDAVEREKVRTAWEVGKLIQEHILLNKPRADYGARVIKRLSKDLATDPSELHRMVEFAREYPKLGPGRQLSWAHHKMLLGINDKAKRDEITRKAEAGDWSKRELRREINKQKAAKEISVSRAPTEELLVPIKGKSDTYRVITAVAGPWKGRTALDLGFSNYYLPPKGRSFPANTIVQVREGKLVGPVKGVTEADLFTYRAYILKITDGDTLWVLIDLGFGFTTKQQLRLRGLDAPEINTREGVEAKRFVEKELKNVSQLVIASTQSDKYDRYLADIFYTVNGQERFLNQRLLDAGHAERV